ncbi:hypothetical protein OG756_41495 (plasmid) [Streptomyces sp. NBC_01310]|uniref:hypothetical protein n=1 Tax=Streptomyces TaxID=1883 RepID=UPI002257324A|nr:hypothetical protein [Streptomyces virginiae]MCX5278051.1 hypothetical protein [Streptomyces virginiae]WSJ64494.1 hypothetical protein OG756_41495 [Streptomyces sp. NBC_01310]
MRERSQHWEINPDALGTVLRIVDCRKLEAAAEVHQVFRYREDEYGGRAAVMVRCTAAEVVRHGYGQFIAYSWT